MWVDEIDHHLRTECRSRPVECLLNCGAQGLVASTEEHHRIHLCPYRLMTCSCRAVLRTVDHSDHLIADCPDKPTLCPQGCGAIIGRSHTDIHIEFECPKKGTFFTRMQFCPG